MIEIKHKEYAGINSNYIVNKIEDATEIKINTQMVDEDISRLKSEIGKTKNRIDNKNIVALVDYLGRIKKAADNNNGVIEICWHMGMDGLPKSYPIQFINEPLYKINIANYIELDSNKKYINMDMIDMADIIAYEFINRDLGEDHASIEKLLEQCGLIGYEDASLLINKFKADGDEMYKLSQQMFVGETTYLEADVDRNLIDYFYTKKFSMGDKTTYRDVVNYSCRYANNIVANSIVSNCGAIGINLRPISVAPTYIDFILTEKQGSTVNIDRDIMDKISIHAFGRKFIVTPKLTII